MNLLPITMHEPSSTIPAELLDQYLAGTLSAAERAMVEQLLQSSEVERDLIAAVREAPSKTVGTFVPDRERVWRMIRAARETPSQRMVTRRTSWMHALVGGAAIAGLCVLTALGVWHHDGEMQRSRTYVTGIGERARVMLADGNTILLAPRTTLTLHTGFGARTRMASLVGEAYFTVTQGAHMLPFEVRTGHVTTRVLGTVFDVRRYLDENDTRVVVTQGRVSTGLSTGTQRTVTLAAGTSGLVTDSAVLVASGPNATHETSWTDGTLVFNRAPVSDVLATLGQWYGLHFTLADSVLEHRHVTAVFEGTTRAEMLAAIASLLNVQPTITGVRGDITLILLRPRNSAAPLGPRSRNAADSLTNLYTEYGR